MPATSALSNPAASAGSTRSPRPAPRIIIETLKATASKSHGSSGLNEVTRVVSVIEGAAFSSSTQGEMASPREAHT